jgi:hypothetical protein
MNLVHGAELTSLLWNEYLRTNIECINFAEIRVSRMQNILSNIVFEKDLKFRIVSMLENTLEAKGLLSIVLKENAVGKPVDLGLHFRYRGLSYEIQLGLSDLQAILLQKFFEQFSEIERQKISFFKTPTQTTKAISAITEECSYVLYGDSSQSLDRFRPIVVSWPYSSYQFLRASTAISMPPHDAVKLCHWSVLMHESFHSKQYGIVSFASKLDDARKSKNNSLVKTYESILRKLLSNSWEKTIDNMNALKEHFVKTMLQRVGETYRQTFDAILDQHLSIAKEDLETQFDEILCDIATVKATGPCTVLLSGSSEADACRNPFLDVSLHLYELQHPPDIVRVLYKFEVLKDPKLGFNKETVSNVWNEIKGLVSVDLVGRRKKWPEKITAEFLDIYLNALMDTKLLPQMSDLVDQILCKKAYYHNKRWNDLLGCYEKCKDSGQAKDALRPFDFVNLAWLKLTDICRQGLSYKNYHDAYKNEHTFFENIWKGLISSGTTGKAD